MKQKKGFIQFLMNPRKWWIPLTIIFLISITGVGIIGFETYHEAPPIPDFVNENGDMVFSEKEILDGQAVFQRLALMDYGSMFGDGANRGPDFTAQALHEITTYLNDYYGNQPDLSKMAYLGVREQVKRELRENKYERLSNRVRLTASQEYACSRLVDFYYNYFKSGSEQQSLNSEYLGDREEIRKLSAFFFWIVLGWCRIRAVFKVGGQ